MKLRKGKTLKHLLLGVKNSDKYNHEQLTLKQVKTANTDRERPNKCT